MGAAAVVKEKPKNSARALPPWIPDQEWTKEEVDRAAGLIENDQRSARDYRSNGIANILATNNRGKTDYLAVAGPCHGFISHKYPMGGTNGLRSVISTITKSVTNMKLTRLDEYHKASASEEHEKYDRWYDWLVKESPWRYAFIPINDDFHHKIGTVLSADVPSNYLMGALQLTRAKHQNCDYIDRWWELQENGLEDKTLAYIASVLFNYKYLKGLTNEAFVYPSTMMDSHNPLSKCNLSDDYIRNIINCSPVNIQPTYRENPDYKKKINNDCEYGFAVYSLFGKNFRIQQSETMTAYFNRLKSILKGEDKKAPAPLVDPFGRAVDPALQVKTKITEFVQAFKILAQEKGWTK